MVAEPLSFEMHVTVVSEGLGRWSAACTPCGQQLAFLVPPEELPALIVGSIKHICDRPTL